MDKNRCENCKWFEFYGGDWYCTNTESEYYGVEADKNDSCGEFKEKR